ncbi:uncharacterized protein LOC132558290 [Ylistrum balloti]|uniref:uncharacterized protein LOC132558290 n=1 Tax=Ylistrum balloti TaxID=509963 RepID=UPI002905BE84|nr:uncharacterized protein LOC132558290 [Ylistrum balloti]
MANLGYLITVCVLFILSVSANAQCAQATNCLSHLGINISAITPSGGVSGDLTVICRNTSQVVHCYDILTACPDLASFSNLLPGKNQMRKAITTVCQNENVLEGGFACLGRNPTFPSEISGCATQVRRKASSLTPSQINNLQGTFCSLMDSLLTCVTSMSSVQSCGSDFKSTLVTFEHELLPATCPANSGCSKMDSLLYFTLLGAVIPSIYKRL